MARDADRERKYGMEPGDIAAFDHGLCWICQQPETSIEGRSLAVDHDHATGAVRGFLCYRCNTILGWAKDQPDLLRQAADYLERARMDFADVCEQCIPDESANPLTAPAELVEQESPWVVFGFECARGHRWTCGFKTEGTPFIWRY